MAPGQQTTEERAVCLQASGDRARESEVCEEDGETDILSRLIHEEETVWTQAGVLTLLVAISNIWVCSRDSFSH